ncbi:MAG: hypothetical protein HY678_09040 [Chloroflexi bacterium]|nr:hypothetical protein [Chloroflexota bacterium]
MTSTNDLEGVDALYRQLGAAAKAGNFAAYSELFSDSGVLMPPNAPVVSGGAAIREWAR